jgi:translation initiation factor IF-3
MQHPELGRKILNQVADAVSHVGLVEMMPKQDGRNMIMVLGPDKKAMAARKKAEDEGAESDALSEADGSAESGLSDETAAETTAD